MTTDKKYSQNIVNVDNILCCVLPDCIHMLQFAKNFLKMKGKI